ncbi:hypothetical protein [Janthinobacterium lividum]|uniref:hypothetical protein n=1 Tax=Janthinobacterium lividum TaxID=29581 RepID=UPI003D201334
MFFFLGRARTQRTDARRFNFVVFRFVQPLDDGRGHHGAGGSRASAGHGNAARFATQLVGVLGGIGDALLLGGGGGQALLLRGKLNVRQLDAVFQPLLRLAQLARVDAGVFQTGAQDAELLALFSAFQRQGLRDLRRRLQITRHGACRRLGLFYACGQLFYFLLSFFQLNPRCSNTAMQFAEFPQVSLLGVQLAQAVTGGLQSLGRLAGTAHDLFQRAGDLVQRCKHYL